MGIVNITDMSFGYLKDITVLKSINLNILEKEKVGIIGANGVGKSTLLRLLTGLECEYEGKIEISNISVNRKSLKELRRHIGYVFQDSDAQMFLTTVYDNVAFGPINYGAKGDEIEKAVNDALSAVSISHLKDKPVYMLSGGEKKLASIATVLSMNPEVLIFDEPSVALDPKNRRRLINVLNEIDKTMIIASHDLDFIIDTCDRVIVLRNHSIECDGSVKDTIYNEELLERCDLELPLSLQNRN